MSEDLLCPFMSYRTKLKVQCEGKRCMAWGERIDRYIDAYSDLRYQSNEGCRLIP